jgi:hypothetical protein
MLTACAGLHKQQVPTTWLTPGTKVQLPAPGITPAINSQQLLTATIKGQSHSLLVLLTADNDQLTLVGLSSLGIRLFKVTYDASGIHTEQSIALPDLPPAAQVLGDIMLSYWPVAAWQAQLPSGWTLLEQAGRRELRDAKGTLIIEIAYDGEGDKRVPVSVAHHVFAYRIAIESLDH